jgi:hypothetical protein
MGHRVLNPRIPAPPEVMTLAGSLFGVMRFVASAKSTIWIELDQLALALPVRVEVIAGKQPAASPGFRFPQVT